MTEQQTIEAQGSDVEEAIEAGLRRLGVGRKDVVIEILEEGRKGLLGLGSREARVRLTTIQMSEVAPASAPEEQPEPPAESAMPHGAEPEAAPEPEGAPGPEAAPEPPAEASVPIEPEAAEQKAPKEEEVAPAPAIAEVDEKEQPEAELDEAPAEAAVEIESEEADTELGETVREIVSNLVQLMGFEDATVSVSYSEPDDLTGRVMTTVEVNGDNLGSLIGPHGGTLADLQYLARLMAGHALRRRAHFMVDVDGYRRQRKVALSKLAERMAEKAIRREEPVTLEPMSAYDRRLVHVALRDHEEVYTNSVGEGSNRRVRIYLKQ